MKTVHLPKPGQPMMLNELVSHDTYSPEENIYWTKWWIGYIADLVINNNILAHGPPRPR